MVFSVIAKVLWCLTNLLYACLISMACITYVFLQTKVLLTSEMLPFELLELVEI